MHVVAAIQDPSKEVLPFRDLFPARIGLRLAEAAQVDLVLGDGMRDRGALYDRIPQSLPGVGYVVIDGGPTPIRVRFSYPGGGGNVRQLRASHPAGQSGDRRSVARDVRTQSAAAPGTPGQRATARAHGEQGQEWRAAALRGKVAVRLSLSRTASCGW